MVLYIDGLTNAPHEGGEADAGLWGSITGLFN